MKRVFLYSWEMADAGIEGHPCRVMSNVLQGIGKKYHHSRPQSLFDGWEFWIDDDVDLSLFNGGGVQYVRELEYKEYSS